MVIANGVLCDIHGQRRVDIRLKDGVIVELGEHLECDEIIDASGCYVVSSLVDTNVRLKDLKLNGKNLESLSREALRGGVGYALLSGDSNPSVDNEITLEFVQKHKNIHNGTHLGCVVDALDGAGRLSDISILLKGGAQGLYTKTISDYNLIIRMAQYLQNTSKPLFYRAQEASLFESGVMSDGMMASSLGLPGISPMSEVVHVASMIEIAREYGITIVFQSIVEPRCVELIAQARRDGVNVWCEVSLHHLLKSDEACSGFDTDAKINPPLGNESKRQQLLEALDKGNIHLLSALHQPNSDVHKDITFFDAYYGTTAIGEYLPLCYTYLIKSGLLDWKTFVHLASRVPASLIGKNAGEIVVGSQADLVIFDPSQEIAVAHHHSLYKNELLSGKVTIAIQGNELTRF
jgi:dihydroorotase